MKQKISKEEQYKTLLVLVTGLVVLGIFSKKPYLPIAAGVIGLLSVLFPVAGFYIVLGWTKIGQGLGWVNSRIILSIIFFVFLVPIAIAYRISSKNPLRLKRDNESLYTVRNHLYVSADLKNSW